MMPTTATMPILNTFIKGELGPTIAIARLIKANPTERIRTMRIDSST